MFFFVCYDFTVHNYFMTLNAANAHLIRLKFFNTRNEALNSTGQNGDIVTLHVHLGKVVPWGVFMRWFAFLHK